MCDNGVFVVLCVLFCCGTQYTGELLLLLLLLLSRAIMACCVLRVNVLSVLCYVVWLWCPVCCCVMVVG